MQTSGKEIARPDRFPSQIGGVSGKSGLTLYPEPVAGQTLENQEPRD
jgi:hypothetical protein